MRTSDLIFHAHQNLLHSAWIVLNGSAAIKRVSEEQCVTCRLRAGPNMWPDSLLARDRDFVMAPNRDVLLNASIEILQSRLRDAIENEDGGLVICENSYNVKCGHYDRFAELRCVEDFLQFGSPDHKDLTLVVFNRKNRDPDRHTSGYDPFCGFDTKAMTQHSIIRGYFESNVAEEKKDRYYVPSAYLYMSYADKDSSFCDGSNVDDGGDDESNGCSGSAHVNSNYCE